jgi:hypothetical protein
MRLFEIKCTTLALAPGYGVFDAMYAHHIHIHT